MGPPKRGPRKKKGGGPNNITPALGVAAQQTRGSLKCAKMKNLGDERKNVAPPRGKKIKPLFRVR